MIDSQNTHKHTRISDKDRVDSSKNKSKATNGIHRMNER